MIADALVVVAGKDPHWDESARAFIRGVILHLKTAKDYEGRRNLLTLRNSSVGGTEAELAALAVRDANTTTPRAASFRRRRRIFSTARKMNAARCCRRRGVIWPLSTCSATSRSARFTLETHSFDLAALKAKPTTIYLCLPARHIGTCNRWLRLFVNLTLQSMEQTRGPAAGRRPCPVRPR